MAKTVKKTLYMLGVCAGLMGLAQGSVLAQSALDQFRTGTPPSQQEEGQKQQEQQQSQGFLPSMNTPSVGDNRRLPPPTIGGFQQGLSQQDIAESLQDYNFDSGMTLEERQAEAEARAREAAFEATLNGTFPLKPEEIIELMDRYRDVREAQETRIGGKPKPEIKLETVTMDPGSTPPVITLTPNHVTTLNIIDVTGAKWPIEDISWGGNFEIIQPREGENIVRISPMKAHEVGNISMQLLELDTPIVFTLQTELESFQVRYDAQIPLYGPNAAAELIDNGPATTAAAAGDREILQILDGTPPGNATKLTLMGVDGRTTAYDVDGRYYVRTPLSMLSPGWTASLTSADGTSVYRINQSPVLLLSERGKMVRATVDYDG